MADKQAMIAPRHLTDSIARAAAITLAYQRATECSQQSCSALNNTVASDYYRATPYRAPTILSRDGYPSICLSQSGIVSKRQKLSTFFRQPIASFSQSKTVGLFLNFDVKIDLLLKTAIYNQEITECLKGATCSHGHC